MNPDQLTEAARACGASAKQFADAIEQIARAFRPLLLEQLDQRVEQAGGRPPLRGEALADHWRARLTPPLLPVTRPFTGPCYRRISLS